jgi:hypothetical protein
MCDSAYRPIISRMLLLVLAPTRQALHQNNHQKDSIHPPEKDLNLTTLSALTIG